ncbi:3-hydroxyacyl-CoA dehydrogenase NAD-binding domain-containing protein [Streptomyces cyaneofuscatus]|uniref:3-hydroxyacyl-CoA dehydrogenase NAD-binding domain-containing protein n=1 Tax=Streptomyces cyaneofuscatus TaxID=66883 RepID=UPI0033BA0036
MRAVERGKLTAEQRTAALGRLRLTSDQEDLADRQLVIGVHFFNPVPVQPLIELITTQLTATKVIDLTAALAKNLPGKTVIQAPDRAGLLPLPVNGSRPGLPARRGEFGEGPDSTVDLGLGVVVVG